VEEMAKPIINGTATYQIEMNQQEHEQFLQLLDMDLKLHGLNSLGRVVNLYNVLTRSACTEIGDSYKENEEKSSKEEENTE